MEKSKLFLEHIPKPLRDSIVAEERLRSGFVDKFLQISPCLDRQLLPATNDIRNRINISQKKATRDYIRRGGNHDDVVRPVFEQARSGCAYACEGSGLRLYGDMVNDLKRCQNVYEYSIAALACGSKHL